MGLYARLSFPAPTSPIDLNSHNDKTHKVTPMTESLRTMQIVSLLDSQRLLVFFFGGGGGGEAGHVEAQKIFVQGSMEGKIV